MKKQVQKIKENKGFSMIELIIVVAIMAILVGIIGAALIPYMEKSRASKDKSILDAVYNAYSSAIAETEDPSKLTLDSPEVKALMDGTVTDLQKKFKSKQFKGTTIKCFYSDAGYGVYIEGKSPYSGVQIDNSGAEHKVGVKGTSNQTAEGTSVGSIPSGSGSESTGS